MPYWQDTFSTGYVNPKGHLDITTSQESAIVSILSAGTFFGALFSPFMGDYIGRRWALMLSTWVFNLGVALQTASTAIPSPSAPTSACWPTVVTSTTAR